MNGYLLDTNVISESGKRPANPAVAAFLADRNDLWISTLTIHELTFGAGLMPMGKKREAVFHWIESLGALFDGRVLGLTWEAAALAGRFRAQSKRRGENGVEFDALIAGIAAAGGLTVATRNIKDFRPMGIAVLNPWTGERA